MATGCSHHGEMAHDEKEEVEYGGNGTVSGRDCYKQQIQFTLVVRKAL